MKSYRYSLFILMLLITVLGCRKESSITDIDTTIPGPEIYIESEVFGLVKSQDGNPIENAQVSWGTATTLSDQNGFFKLRSTVPEKIAVLNIKKENYFEAHQTLSAIKENSIQTSVQLIERILTGSISATAGGTINVSGGGQVDFTANSFKDENGNAYSGDVNIYTTYLDPTRTDLREVMPGNLVALNTANELQYLKSFGMINVELEGSNGQKIQLSEAATLSTPVPDLLINDAPNSIPLWHFDTESGLWKQEGEATLQNGSYVGEVTHFSWWNCDDQIDLVWLNGHINVLSGPVNVDVRITRPDGTACTAAASNTGHFSGYIPKNELLTFEIIDVCGNVVYSEEIGPFDQDYIGFEIFLDLSALELITLSGTAINCDGLPVSNGYVLINGLNEDLTQLIQTESDGTFSSTFYNCGVESIVLIAADLDEGLQSEPEVFMLQENTTVGAINTCADEIASVQITVDGIDEVLFVPCITTLVINGIGNPVYNISFESIQADGNVSYFLNIQDENNNPNDPSYSYVYGNNPIDSPEIKYTSLSVLSTNSITKLSSNESIGDLVHFFIDDALMTKQTIDYTTGQIMEEVLNNCTIEIKATLVQ